MGIGKGCGMGAGIGNAWVRAAEAKVWSSNCSRASIHLTEPHKWAYLCLRLRSLLLQLGQEEDPSEVQNPVDICLAVAFGHNPQSKDLSRLWRRLLPKGLGSDLCHMVMDGLLHCKGMMAVRIPPGMKALG